MTANETCPTGGKCPGGAHWRIVAQRDAESRCVGCGRPRSMTAIRQSLDHPTGPPPCEAAPLTWNSTDLQSHRVAREGCLKCPARRECRALAFGAQVATGTFGGDLHLNGIPSVVYA